MKKIGLTTIYSVPNYGSVLQTYATQEVFKKIGFECYIIKYKYPNNWHYKQKGFTRPSFKSKVALFLGLRPNHRKQKKLEKFKDKFFNFTREYKSLSELESENWNDYFAVVVGSDQVWNSRFLKGDSAFMLSYVPDNIKKISIASSFASKYIPEEYKEKYKQFLSRFNAFSVRERNGIEIINKQLEINNEVQVLLDPTLLLSKEDWLNLIPRSKFKKVSKYILFYMLDYAFDPKPYIFEVVSYFAKKYGYDVIALEGYKDLKDDYGIEMINKTDSSINEFIDLFANADLVITSSFHGTAFSVNFGKPVISIIPDDKGDDRLSNLLNTLNLKQCIIPIKTKIEDIKPNYNIKTEQEILRDRRNESLAWIINNIK